MESGVYFSLSVVPQLPEHSVKLFLKTSEFGLSQVSKPSLEGILLLIFQQ